MKNLSLLCVIVLVVTTLASCGSSPYKKRKGCRGNGSWYGKRNLGAVDFDKNTTQDIYALAKKENNQPF